MRGDYFRSKAQHCRSMMAVAMNSEVREQLRVWSHEFDELANAAERREVRRQALRGGWKRLRLRISRATA